MEYLTAQEIADRWNLSKRTVQQLCAAGRIPGARKFTRAWAIPADAEKPEDPPVGSAEAGTAPGSQ